MDHENVISTCVLLKIRKSSRIITRIMDNILQDYNIRVTQFQILAMIGANKDEIMYNLAPMMGKERTTLSRGILLLKMRGFVEVTPRVDDRRCVAIRLTKQGEDIFNEIYPIWDRYNLKLERLMKNKSLFTLGEQELKNALEK